MSRARKFAVVTALILTFTILTSGQTPQPVQLVIDLVIQKDAPVRIVGRAENGDNALYTVTIKNATDKYIQDFEITWTAFRPVNCAASGPAPRIQQMTRVGQSAWAVDRGLFTSLVNQLLHSHLGLGGGARVLKPHEQTEVASWLSRTALLEMAPKYNAKKVRVQVGIAYVNFATGDEFTNHNGPPDWRDTKVEHTNILDAEDAASQACSLLGLTSGVEGLR
jgi:hypothetical protein